MSTTTLFFLPFCLAFDTGRVCLSAETETDMCWGGQLMFVVYTCSQNCCCLYHAQELRSTSPFLCVVMSAGWCWHPLTKRKKGGLCLCLLLLVGRTTGLCICVLCVKATLWFELPNDNSLYVYSYVKVCCGSHMRSRGAWAGQTG